MRLFGELLPDQVRLLGPLHPHTLRIRSYVARWTGEAGEAGEALRLFNALLSDQVRVLGPLHPHTLSTRDAIAKLDNERGDESARGTGPTASSDAVLP